MQVFRLVRPGVVDTVIGFDELPNSILNGITRGPVAGFPRHWKEFLGVDIKDSNAKPFYVLDYILRNQDKEKWQEIVSYVKRNVAPTVRMLDKVEAMAKPLALDSISDLTLEPEDVPVIPLVKIEGDSSLKENEDEPKQKRRGRKPLSEPVEV